MTVDINIARKTWPKPFILNEQEYLAVLQNRVNPQTLDKVSDTDDNDGTK